MKLASANLKDKAEQLLMILANDPYQSPPSFKKLKGTSTPIYSRRISIQHRLVYQILEQAQVVKILRMWSHYGE